MNKSKTLTKVVFISIMVLSQLLYPLDSFAAVFSLKYKHNFTDKTGFLTALSGDVDGDGIKDIVAYKIRDGNPGTILVKAEWSATGLTEISEIIPAELSENTSSSPGLITAYTLADIDNDNKDEVVLVTLNNGAKDSKVSVYKWTGTSFTRQWISDDVLNNVVNTKDYGGIIISLTTGDTDNNGKKEIALSVIEPNGTNIESTNSQNRLTSSPVMSRIVVFERQDETTYTQIQNKLLGDGLAYRLTTARVDEDVNTEFVVDMVDLNITNINAIIDHYKNVQFSSYSYTNYSQTGYYAPVINNSQSNVGDTITPQIQNTFENQLLPKLLGLDQPIIQKLKSQISKLTFVNKLLNTVNTQIKSAAPFLYSPGLRLSPGSYRKSSVQTPALAPTSGPSYTETTVFYEKPEISFTGETFTNFKTDIASLFKGELKIIQNDFTVSTIPLTESFINSQSITDINNDGKDELIVKTFDWNYTTINKFFTDLNINQYVKQILNKETEYRIPTVQDSKAKMFYPKNQYLLDLINPKTGQKFLLSDTYKTHAEMYKYYLPTGIPTISNTVFTSKLIALKPDGTKVWTKDTAPFGKIDVKGNEIISAATEINLTELNAIISHYSTVLQKSVALITTQNRYVNMNQIMAEMDKFIPNLSATFISTKLEVMDLNGTVKNTVSNIGTFVNKLAGLGDTDTNGSTEIAGVFTNINWTNINLIITQANDYLKKYATWELTEKENIDKHNQQIITYWNKWAPNYYLWYSSPVGSPPTFNEDVNGNNILDRTEDLNGNGILDNEDVGLDGFPNTKDYGEGNGYLDYISEDSLGTDGIPYTSYKGDTGENDGILQPKEDLNKNGILDRGYYPEDKNNNYKIDTEDFDGNGILTIDSYLEDKNKTGTLDPSEDVNGNGILDFGEDLNANGIIDHYSDWSLNKDVSTQPRWQPDLGLNFVSVELKVVEGTETIYRGTSPGLYVAEIIPLGNQGMSIVSTNVDYTVIKSVVTKYRYYTTSYSERRYEQWTYDYYGNKKPAIAYQETVYNFAAEPIVYGTIALFVPERITVQKGTVTGKVTDQNGNPIANATILATQGYTLGGPTATTGSDGSYTLADIPAGTYFISCFPPAGTGYVGKLVKDVVLTNGENKIVDFKFTGLKVSGIVTGDGQPIANAMVIITGLKTGIKQVAYTVTSGTYTITGLPSDIYTITCFPINKLNYTPITVTKEITYSQTENFTFTTTVTPGLISGKVLNSQNQPLRGALVLAFSSGTVLTAEKDTLPAAVDITPLTGTYTLKQLAPGNYDIYAIQIDLTLQTATANDYSLNLGRKVIAKQNNVEVSTGSTITVNLIQPVNVGSVSGKITMGDGLPVSSATVVAISRTTGLSSVVTTPTDGMYKLENIEPGVYMIIAGRKDIGANFISDVKVEPGKDTANIDLSLYWVMTKNNEDTTITLRSVKIEVKPQVLEKDAKLIVNANPPSEKIKTAEAKLNLNPTFKDQVWEIKAVDVYDVTQNVSLRTGQKIKISLPYPAGVDPTKLKLYWLNETTETWELVNTVPTVDQTTQLVSAEVEHLSYYRLAPATAGSDVTLSQPDKQNIIVYPVPYKPAVHKNTGITFKGWTETGTVKIYTVSGELVAKIDKTDTTDGIVWKDTPALGLKPEDVPSGVYIYLINDKVKGKIAIIK